jgi:hypothetical protein
VETGLPIARLPGQKRCRPFNQNQRIRRDQRIGHSSIFKRPQRSGMGRRRQDHDPITKEKWRLNHLSRLANLPSAAKRVQKPCFWHQRRGPGTKGMVKHRPSAHRASRFSLPRRPPLASRLVAAAGSLEPRSSPARADLHSQVGPRSGLARGLCTPGARGIPALPVSGDHSRPPGIAQQGGGPGLEPAPARTKKLLAGVLSSSAQPAAAPHPLQRWRGRSLPPQGDGGPHPGQRSQSSCS